MKDAFSNPAFIGIAAGILTAVSMLPQLFTIIAKKKTADISIGMLIILLSGVSLWIYYGILKKDLPIIYTNSFSFLINLLVLFFSLLYQKRKR